MSHSINTINPGPDVIVDAQTILSQVARLSFQELDALHQGISERLGDYRAGMKNKSNTVDNENLVCLTPRELEVLTLVANGYTRREVGDALSITQNTAATHISTIYRKLDISSIAEATVLAIRSGLVS